MDLRTYFEQTKGKGILASADAEGRVDAAVYAKPHFLEDGTIGFIMQDRLTHHNLQSNPYAAYLFLEDGPGYRGLRLFLKKLSEEQDTERLYAMRRRSYAGKKEPGKPLFFVAFEVEKELPLIGAGRDPEVLD
jgi:hypothetical protein